MMRRIGAVVAAMVAVGWVLAACAGAEPAATVNGTPVDQQVLFQYMLKRHGSRSLVNLITAEVIRQAAEKAGVKVTDAEVDASVAKKRETWDRTAIETGVDFEIAIFSQGDTLTTFRESERTLLLLQGLVAKDVKIADEAVQEYYRTHLADYKVKEGMKVSFIRMDDLDQMTEVRKAVIAGGITFEQAAKQHSNDPYTKDNGGKVDRWLGRGNTPFLQAAYSLLKDGDTSEIMPFPGLGYYLVRRDQYVRDYQLDFDEVKADIRELLETQTTQNLAAAKQRELMKAADIKFLLTWPEGSFMPPKPPEAPKPPGGANP
jgi:foldase protein PrsA